MAAAPEVVFGPGPHRLLVDGQDVAALAVADSPASRRKGLLGTDRLEGALWITQCPTVHMVGMRYPIDAAVLDKRGIVIATASLRPTWGMTWLRLRARVTVEMPAGSLQAWGISVGSQLAIG